MLKIFKEENLISEQILCDILKGTVFEKMGDLIRANGIQMYMSVPKKLTSLKSHLLAYWLGMT